MENIIHYGFGVDYLPNWGIKQALREVYQNFLDYGEYTETVDHNEETGISHVCIKNNWQPDNLEFLRIGNSQKGGQIAIGKHGEGLKMAFLIFQREGFASDIFTPKYMVTPSLYVDQEIGECFCMKYHESEQVDEIGFMISFRCKTLDYLDFKDNLITKDDIIFTDKVWGSIVNKPVGNIYSGGLFVARFDNMVHAYDIRPDRLPLDRDRSVPGHFDVSYATSNILGSYGKFKARDVVKMDTAYVGRIPEETVQEFKAVMVGNDVNFTYEDDEVIQEEELLFNEETNEEEVILVDRVVKVDKVVSNPYVKSALKGHSFFQGAINKLKRTLASQLGLNELLIEFKKKHVHGSEAEIDFNVILERAGIEVEQTSDLLI